VEYPVTDSYDIKAISEEALVFIEQYSISKTPIHYTVAFEFAKGENQNLVEFIDQAIFKQQPINSALLEVAYKKFISITDDEVIHTVQEKLNTIVTDILSQVDPFSKLSNLFEEKMLEAIKRIHKVTSKESLQEVVNKVAQNTQAMNEASHKFNHNLSTLSDELHTLKKSFAKVKEAALTDSLTQILNRRGFESQYQKEVASARERSSPLSLLLIDVDHFKKFNDTYGHLVGDEVLKFIALSCKKRIRPTDTVARFGGEEFIVILPNTHSEQAFKIAEALRMVFEKTKLQRKEEPKDLGKLTVSIGIAILQKDDNFDSIFERADKALYLAKEKGRNCIQTEADL
jgi:diguanylate cyclase